VTIKSLWAVESATLDGAWEIADNGETLEIFTREQDARDAMSEYLNGSDGNEDNFRLVCFARTSAGESNG
jgi:hypothetical protein